MSDIPEITNKFKVGDIVTVKQDASVGKCEIVNPCDPTDMKRINGDPVGHYVRIKINSGEILGYHEANLVLV